MIVYKTVFYYMNFAQYTPCVKTLVNVSNKINKIYLITTLICKYLILSAKYYFINSTIGVKFSIEEYMTADSNIRQKIFRVSVHNLHGLRQ